MRRIVPIVALLLAACGGDASFVDVVEEACDERDRAVNELVQPIPDEVTPAYISKVVEGSVPIIREYLEAVEDADPPDELRETHEEYAALLRDTLARYQDAVGDEAAEAAVFNQQAPDYQRLEQALRLPTCGTLGNGLEESEDEPVSRP